MINKKVFFLLFLFGLAAGGLWADQRITLPGLSRPSLMEADQHRLYIVDDPYVLIYSLEDFKLVKKFGGKGEGPREFKIITSISLSPDQLLVNSRGKLSFFSRQGEFLKEIKAVRGSDFSRLGNQFVGLDMEVKDKISHITLNLYDSGLKKIKEINRHKGLYLGSKHLDPILIYAPLGPQYRVWGDKLLVKNGNLLKIVSKAGTTETVISPASGKIAPTSAHKQKILDFYRTNFRTRANFPALKKKFKFPDHFPAVRNYHIDGKRLYILTFKEKNGKKEFLVYGNNGRLLKRHYLPVLQAHILELFPYTIRNNHLYQLVEGEEERQLVVTPIR